MGEGKRGQQVSHYYYTSAHSQNEHKVLALGSWHWGSWGGQPAWWGRVGGGELPPCLLACRLPLQAKAHLSTINILSTNYFTWMSKSEDPSISV